MARRTAATRRTDKPESRFDTRRGLLYKGGRLLAVSPLLVALCLNQACLPPILSKRVLPTPVGNRIVRIATFLNARLALGDFQQVANLGGTDERA